ncbi:hypothetical protein N9H39_02185 [Gammaproteobacteria bacterium]|nr:hypothetical protein [Gammaproteobacteria bacterium]
MGQKGFAWSWRTLIKIALIVVVIVCANYLAHWLVDQLEIEVTPRNEHIVHRVIIATAILYAILIAIPFVPGIEIGVALIMVLGADMAFLVFVFTILGLSISFMCGRLVPHHILQKMLNTLSLHRAGKLISDLAPLDPDQKLQLISSRAPSKWIPTLLRFRYVAVAVALNIPGNAIVGGGGGICLLAGMTRMFGISRFLLTLAIAVSPVPLLITFYGFDILG